MKKIIAIVLCLMLLLAAAGCTGQNSNQGNGGQNQGNNGQNQGGSENPDPEKIAFEVSVEGDVVSFTRLPETETDLEALDFTDEKQVAAAILAALAVYETDSDSCFALLNVLKGPEEISAYDKSFIKEQFSQYPYVARSYMEGASLDNGYKVDTVSFRPAENLHSRDEEGYVKLYFKSAGAETERGVTLRQKTSTGEWFLFSDSYKGLLSGVQNPDANNGWN